MNKVDNDTSSATRAIIMNCLEQVKDPEIPVLSIIDLGIVRDVQIDRTNEALTAVNVLITPTYTGCPAMDMITAEIKMRLHELGFHQLTVTHTLSPAWTTDWMTELGKQRLTEYGIAAPNKRFSIPEDGVTCPQCKSTNTRLLSEFSSTACKALYQCQACKEPFDYFKCH